MRITIDTDLQVIIVPNSYYAQVDKLNEVIIEAGGRPLDYKAYIRTCFEKAYNSQIICSADVQAARGTKSRSRPTSARVDDGDKV